MNNYDYDEIGEAIGAVIGCFLALLIVAMVVVAIVVLPFMVIAFLTGNPSAF